MLDDSTGTPRIGVVLSSGGGRGVFAHTGFLLALKILGIEVSAISGCSAGALVGGVAASGTDLKAWSDTIADVRTKDYWRPDSLPRIIWRLGINKGRGYSGISGTEAAIDFCRCQLTAQTFAACAIPFHALAMNIGRGSKEIFSDGELAPRIMASAAMPVLYRPVEINGELYTDGAVIDFAPTEAICCKYKLDALILHHAAVHREGVQGLVRALNQPWSLVEILNLLLYRQRPWYLSDQPLSFQHCPCECGAPIIVLEPDLPELIWPLSSGGREIQAVAQQQAEALLQPHLENLLSQPQRLLQEQSIQERS